MVHHSSIQRRRSSRSARLHIGVFYGIRLGHQDVGLTTQTQPKQPISQRKGTVTQDFGSTEWNHREGILSWMYQANAIVKSSSTASPSAANRYVTHERTATLHFGNPPLLHQIIEGNKSREQTGSLSGLINQAQFGTQKGSEMYDISAGARMFGTSSAPS